MYFKHSKSCIYSRRYGINASGIEQDDLYILKDYCCAFLRILMSILKDATLPLTRIFFKSIFEEPRHQQDLLLQEWFP